MKRQRTDRAEGYTQRRHVPCTFCDNEVRVCCILEYEGRNVVSEHLFSSRVSNLWVLSLALYLCWLWSGSALWCLLCAPALALALALAPGSGDVGVRILGLI